MVERVDVSRLSGEDVDKLMGGEESEHINPIRLVDEDLADAIAMLSLWNTDYVRGTPEEMTKEWTMEASEEGIALLNETLKVLDIHKIF